MRAALIAALRHAAMMAYAEAAAAPNDQHRLRIEGLAETLTAQANSLSREVVEGEQVEEMAVTV